MLYPLSKAVYKRLLIRKLKKLKRADNKRWASDAAHNLAIDKCIDTVRGQLMNIEQIVDGYGVPLELLVQIPKGEGE